MTRWLMLKDWAVSTLKGFQHCVMLLPPFCMCITVALSVEQLHHSIGPNSLPNTLDGPKIKQGHMWSSWDEY